MFVVEELTSDPLVWTERGRTETIEQDRNPDFLTKIFIEYGSKNLFIRLRLFDESNKRSSNSFNNSYLQYYMTEFDGNGFKREVICLLTRYI